jgi:SAM-dependent methyltransferase
MKLNLGCGQHKLPGFVNVDRFGAPDLKHDLEAFPWPWPDSSVDEVVLQHVLEHLGQTPDTFIGVMKELYRVCKPGALVKIAVPHPRHDNFLGDPTHVRAITADVLCLFSQALNREWEKTGAANTPLGLYNGVDFELVEHYYAFDERIDAERAAGRLDDAALQVLVRERNNIVREIQMTLKAIK